MRDVTIRAYASDESGIEYPVSIDVYDSEANVAMQKTIENATSVASMSLQTGRYTIVATGGDNDFTKGYTTARPLMMGTKDITLTSDITENINMEYKVASVQVTLTDIVSDVTGVVVTLGPQYAGISPIGELSGEITPTINCTQTSDGQWVTGTFYVLPGTGDNTTITITQMSPKETKVFTIVYGSPLEAGKPYVFKGAYDSSYASYMLNVSISAEGWSEDIVSEFDFSDKDADTDIPVSPDTPDTPVTGDALTQGTVWNGHIVALVDGNTATLLSTKEWTLSDVDVLPQSEMDAYSEDGITGWVLPTEEQGKKIAETYSVGNARLAQLNSVLTENDLLNLNVATKSGEDIRYLCGDGTQAYSYVNYATIVGTSDKSRSYRIRLVKTVTIQ